MTQRDEVFRVCRDRLREISMKWRTFKSERSELARHYLVMAKGWAALKRHYAKRNETRN